MIQQMLGPGEKQNDEWRKEKLSRAFLLQIFGF